MLHLLFAVCNNRATLLQHCVQEEVRGHTLVQQQFNNPVRDQFIF